MLYMMWPLPYDLTRELSSIFLTALIDECSQNRKQIEAGVNSPNRHFSISYPKTPWASLSSCEMKLVIVDFYEFTDICDSVAQCSPI